MCSCKKCKAENPETAAVCEICENVFCGPCAGIKPTEARVFTLKNKVLMYLCIECKPVITEKINLAKQIVLYKKLIEDKEIMIKDKQKIIDILDNKKKNNDNINSNIKTINKEEIASSSKPKTSANNTKAYEAEQRRIMQDVINLAKPTADKQVLPERKNTTENEEERNWTVVKNRRNSRKNRVINNVIIGRDTNDEENGIEGVEKRVWLFMSKVKLHVTKEKISKYLTSKPDMTNRKFIVEEISVKRTSSKCFKIGADYDLKDVMYQPGFWPKGIWITRFNFRRNQGMVHQRKDHEEEDTNSSEDFL